MLTAYEAQQCMGGREGWTWPYLPLHQISCALTDMEFNKGQTVEKPIAFCLHTSLSKSQLHAAITLHHNISMSPEKHECICMKSYSGDPLRLQKQPIYLAGFSGKILISYGEDCAAVCPPMSAKERRQDFESDARELAPVVPVSCFRLQTRTYSLMDVQNTKQSSRLASPEHGFAKFPNVHHASTLG